MAIQDKFPTWLKALVGCSGCGCLSLVALVLFMLLLYPPIARQTRGLRETQTGRTIDEVLEAQLKYHQDKDTFAHSMSELDMEFPEEHVYYTYEMDFIDKDSVVVTATSSQKAYGRGFSSKVIYFRRENKYDRKICRRIKDKSKPPYAPGSYGTDDGVQLLCGSHADTTPWVTP